MIHPSRARPTRRTRASRGEIAPRFDSFQQLRHKNFRSIVPHIRTAYEATAAYLADPALVRPAPDP